MENKLVTVNNTNTLENVVVTKELLKSNEFSAQYAALKEAIDTLTEVKKGLDKKISEVIEPLYMSDGTTSVSSDELNFTYCAATTSMTVDSTKLKKEFPEVYSKCVKTSNRAASLRVTKKNA